MPCTRHFDISCAIVILALQARANNLQQVEFHVFLSWLQNIFTPPSTGDPDLDDTRPGFEWNQNVRIVLAMIIVIISAFVVFWILS